MYERLKHLLISSETFQKKKKAEQIAQAKAKQISRGKGVRKYCKGIRYMRISEKGKGLGKNGSKTRITPLHISRRNQASGLTIGIQNKLYCLLDLHVLILVFHFCCTVWVIWLLVVLG